MEKNAQVICISCLKFNEIWKKLGIEGRLRSSRFPPSSFCKLLQRPYKNCGHDFLIAKLCVKAFSCRFFTVIFHFDSNFHFEVSKFLFQGESVHVESTK